MGALTVRSSWLTRMLQRMGLMHVEEHNAGSDFGVETAREPGYSALQAMSAYAAFPWVKAVVNAKATDLSGLPLKLVFGTGADAEVITDHELLDLLGQPSERVNGLLYRRQQWVDKDLTGNAYGLMIGAGPRPQSVLRLHPYRVRIQSMNDGQIDCYQYDQRGGHARYDWSTVLHTRGASWEDDPTGLFGSGLIRALHNDLSADLAASKTSAKAAAKGRPDALISPKDSGQPWTATQVGLIKASVNQKLADAEGGALILGGAAEYKPLSWTPKDMEFQALRLHVREAVLAAAGVPPSRVSLPTANYATAKEGDRTYWMSLQGEAALLDAEWTRLAKRWDPRFSVRHDFSAVPALQEDRTAQVERVHKWWTMGLSLPDAAAFEGFDDLPEPETLSRPSSSAPSDESATGPTKQTPLGAWWRRAPIETPRTEEARAVRWRGFIDRVHAPIERGLNLQLRAFLQEQAARFGKRLADVVDKSAPAGVTRELSQVALAALLAEAEEAKALGEVVAPYLQQALRQAFAATMDELALTIGAGDDVMRAAELKLRADLITNVSETTKDVVSELVRSGLAEGATIQEMQTAIIQSRAFSPARALTIARTETTRAVNKGTVESYRAALPEVPDLKMQWLSARDDTVRDAHVDLDGQVAEVDGRFTDEHGHTAAHPGDFMIPGDDINCRCTTIPYFASESA